MQRTLIILLTLLLACPVALAEVTLPSVFGDHMVLQRDKEVRIWGKAEPGEQVTVEIADDLPPDVLRGDNHVAIYQADANQDGNWQIMLPKHSGKEPAKNLNITGSKTKKPIVFKNVVFGEVWVASGQSNMAWPINLSSSPPPPTLTTTKPSLAR